MSKLVKRLLIFSIALVVFVYIIFVSISINQCANIIEKNGLKGVAEEIWYGKGNK